MVKIMWNVLLNVVIPSVLLIYAKGGAIWIFAVALAFPTTYGIIEFIKDKKTNIFSIIGFFGILLTGGVGILQLDNQWIVIKEAGVPLVVGAIILVSQWMGKPFIKTLFGEIMDLEKIHKVFRKKGRSGDFDEQLEYSSYFLAGAFLVSSILNYILAKIMIVSEPGTTAFNQELGKMTALSFPVIAVPMFIILFFILYFLLSSIKKHTNLEIEDLMKK